MIILVILLACAASYYIYINRKPILSQIREKHKNVECNHESNHKEKNKKKIELEELVEVDHTKSLNAMNGGIIMNQDEIKKEINEINNNILNDVIETVKTPIKKVVQKPILKVTQQTIMKNSFEDNDINHSIKIEEVENSNDIDTNTNKFNSPIHIDDINNEHNEIEAKIENDNMDNLEDESIGTSNIKNQNPMILIQNEFPSEEISNILNKSLKKNSSIDEDRIINFNNSEDRNKQRFNSMDSDEFKSLEEDIDEEDINSNQILNTKLITKENKNNIENSNEETSISLNTTTIENASNLVSVSVDNNQKILNSISSNKSNEDPEEIEKNKVINSLVGDDFEILETNNKSIEKINTLNDFDSDEF